MPRGGRRCKRQETRKQLAYEILQSHTNLERTVPEQKTIQDLFRAVESNQISYFGLEKLSAFDLDELYYVNTSNGLSISLNSSIIMNVSYDKLTLFQYAVHHGRDSIIAALLRAGSNPFRCSCHCMSCTIIQQTAYTTNMMKMVLTRHYQNVVWIIRVIHEIRNKPSAHKTTTTCALLNKCILNQVHTQNKDNNDNNQYCTIIFPICHHIICEACIWTSLFQLEPTLDLSCPVCKLELTTYVLPCTLPKNKRRFKLWDQQTNGSSSSSSSSSSSRHTDTPSRSSTAHMKSISHTGDNDCDHKAMDSNVISQSMISVPSSTSISTCPVSKKESYLRWKQLPISTEVSTDTTMIASTAAAAKAINESDTTETSNSNDSMAMEQVEKKTKIIKSTTRPPFQAHSLTELAGFFIGETQERRSEEWFDAIKSHNLKRIRAIYTTGIDIDIQNIYGQTACYVACWYGYDDVLKLLLSYDVNYTIGDYTGISPLTVAYINKRIKCYELLKEYQHHCSSNIIVPDIRSEDDTLISPDSNNNDINILDTYIPPHSSLNKLSLLFHYTLRSSPSSIPSISQTIKILIPSNSSHPGAGSFYADGFISDHMIDAILSLQSNLPMAPPEKLSCSNRYYYCDTSGIIRHILSQALQQIKTYWNTDLFSNHIESTESSSNTPPPPPPPHLRSCHTHDNNESDQSHDTDGYTSSSSSSSSLSLSYIQLSKNLPAVNTALPHMRFLEYREVGGRLAPHIDLSRMYEPIIYNINNINLSYSSQGSGESDSIGVKRHVVYPYITNVDASLSDTYTCSDDIAVNITNSLQHLSLHSSSSLCYESSSSSSSSLLLSPSSSAFVPVPVTRYDDVSTDASVSIDKESYTSTTHTHNDHSIPKKSTHTFILYLTDCTHGGETILLQKVPGRKFNMTTQENQLAVIQPKRGRLLVFPHMCPHEGGLVTHVPKILLRGEMI